MKYEKIYQQMGNDGVVWFAQLSNRTLISISNLLQTVKLGIQISRRLSRIQVRCQLQRKARVLYRCPLARLHHHVATSPLVPFSYRVHVSLSFSTCCRVATGDRILASAFPYVSEVRNYCQPYVTGHWEDRWVKDLMIRRYGKRINKSISMYPDLIARAFLLASTVGLTIMN